MKLWTDLLIEEGQGLTEYALILGILVVAAATGLMVVGPKVVSLYADTNAKFN